MIDYFLKGKHLNIYDENFNCLLFLAGFKWRSAATRIGDIFAKKPKEWNLNVRIFKIFEFSHIEKSKHAIWNLSSDIMLQQLIWAPPHRRSIHSDLKFEIREWNEFLPPNELWSDPLWIMKHNKWNSESFVVFLLCTASFDLKFILICQQLYLLLLI